MAGSHDMGFGGGISRAIGHYIRTSNYDFVLDWSNTLIIGGHERSSSKDVHIEILHH